MIWASYFEETVDNWGRGFDAWASRQSSFTCISASADWKGSGTEAYQGYVLGPAPHLYWGVRAGCERCSHCLRNPYDVWVCRGAPETINTKLTCPLSYCLPHPPQQQNSRERGREGHAYSGVLCNGIHVRQPWERSSLALLTLIVPNTSAHRAKTIKLDEVKVLTFERRSESGPFVFTSIFWCYYLSQSITLTMDECGLFFWVSWCWRFLGQGESFWASPDGLF